MPLPLSPAQNSSLIAACADPPGAARLLKHVLSKESLHKIALDSGDNDMEGGLGEESDTDGNSDNEANHGQQLQETPPDPLPAGKGRACSLKSTKNGSNQRRICLALRFLLKRIPALMDNPVTPVGAFRPYEWVGSFSPCRDAGCMRNLVQDLRTTEPELRNINITAMHGFYLRFVKMGKILLSYDESDGMIPGQDGVGQQQRHRGYRCTFVSEAMKQLASLEREYRMRLLEKNTNDNRERNMSLASVTSADGSTSRVDRESQDEPRVVGKRRKVDHQQWTPMPYRPSPSATPPLPPPPPPLVSSLPPVEMPCTVVSSLSFRSFRRHERPQQQESEDLGRGLDVRANVSLDTITNQAAVNASQGRYNKVWNSITQHFPYVNTKEGASHTQKFLQRSQYSDQDRQQQQEPPAVQTHLRQLQQSSQNSTTETTLTANSAIVEISDDRGNETIAGDADENIDLDQTFHSAPSSPHTESHILLGDDDDHRDDDDDHRDDNDDHRDDNDDHRDDNDDHRDENKDTGAEDDLLRTVHELAVAGTVGKMDETMRSSNQQTTARMVEVTQTLDKHQSIMSDAQVIRHTLTQQPQSSNGSTSSSIPTAAIFDDKSVDEATRTEAHTRSHEIGTRDTESAMAPLTEVSTTTVEALELLHQQQSSPSSPLSTTPSSMSSPLPSVGDASPSPRHWSSLTELVHTAITRSYDVVSLQKHHRSSTTTAAFTSAGAPAPILIREATVQDTIDLARSYIQRQLYLRQQQQGAQRLQQTGIASVSGAGQSDSTALEAWNMGMVTKVCESLLEKLSLQQQQEQQLLPSPPPPGSITTTTSSLKPSVDTQGERMLTSQSSSQPHPPQSKDFGAAPAYLGSHSTQKKPRYNFRTFAQ